MRTLLGGLAGEFQLPDPPAPPEPEPAPPRVPAQAVLSSRLSTFQTNPVTDVPDDDPESLARAQELTVRHARLRAQAEGLQLVHEVRIPDRNTILLLQLSDQAELDDIWSRQKTTTIACVARGNHRSKDCSCLHIAYEFYRDLQLRHDPESPLLLGAEHVLIPSSERFAREYKLPSVEEVDPGNDWLAVYRSGRRRA